MEKELKEAKAASVGHAVPKLEAGVEPRQRQHPARSRKQQIDLMVNSFAADFARVATLQFTNSVGGARMKWLGITEGHHELSHEPESNKKAVRKS